jgi:uncharacterized protein (UPF0335 family)
MRNKMVIIQFDYSDKNELLSYVEVLTNIEKETPVIYTNCLDFFSFSTLDKGYDVKVVRANGDFILLKDLLKNDKTYTNREIRKAHNVHKMLLANTFVFKSS